MAAIIGDPRLMRSAQQRATVAPRPQQQQQPDLSALTAYNNRSQGGIGEEEVNTEAAQNMLTNLRKYDPNAEFSPTLLGGEGTSGQISYTLNFDPRKLPGVNGQGQLSQGAAGVGTGNTFMPNFSTVQEHMNLHNPDAVVNSRNYGRITDNRNIYDKPAWLDYVGPMAVGGFGLLAGGGGMLASALQKAPGMFNSAVHGGFNPYAAAGMALPFIPGMSPMMANIGRMGLNTLGSQRRGG
jgi:hypothetical protein